MKKILFAGGGTLGPVTPLIALSRIIRRRIFDAELFWIGTSTGPERMLVENEGIHFFSIPTAKVPRFFSFSLFFFPIQFLFAGWRAWKILREVQPEIIIGAGGFTQVPVMLIAWCMHIPCSIHQLDIEMGLSNKIIEPVCETVTTSFPSDNQVATPCRFVGGGSGSEFKKTILVLGGGTGAAQINSFVDTVRDEIISLADIVHITGKGKMGERASGAGYEVREFLYEQDMYEALKNATIVISRAGMGALTELASMSKCVIAIPIPHSHQEKNVQALGDAIETTYSIEKIKFLLQHPDLCREMGEKLHRILPTDTGAALFDKIFKNT